MATFEPETQTQTPKPLWPRSSKRFREGREILRDFCRQKQLHELLPVSGKVIVLDSMLTILDASCILEFNDFCCAAVWDKQKSCYSDVFTGSVYLKVLKWAHRTDFFDAVTVLRGCTLEQYFDNEPSDFRMRPVRLESTSSLADAIASIREHELHGVLMLSPAPEHNLLSVLSLPVIARFIMFWVGFLFFKKRVADFFLSSQVALRVGGCAGGRDWIVRERILTKFCSDKGNSAADAARACLGHFFFRHCI